METKQFNLSEKIESGLKRGIADEWKLIRVKDVKEFIRLLKGEMYAEIQVAKKFDDKDNKRANQSIIVLQMVIQRLDKLAGEKLSK